MSKARDLANFIVNDDMVINGSLTVDDVHYGDENDEGNSGAAVTVDWGLNNKSKVTLTGAATLTFTAPAGPTNLVLKLVQDVTGSRTVAWPAAVLWPAGVTPTLSTGANDIDIFTFYYDGTNYYGGYAYDYS
jgi:hypothetical protein